MNNLHIHEENDKSFDEVTKKNIWRSYFIWAFLFLTLVLLVIKSGYLQFWKSDRLSNQSNLRILREQIEPPIRGTIYDKNGIILAHDVKNYIFAIDPNTYFKKTSLDLLAQYQYSELNSQSKKFITAIAEILTLPKETLFQKIAFYESNKKLIKRKKSNYIVLQKDAKLFEVKQLVNLKSQFPQAFNSLIFKAKYQRFYPQREIFSHLTGYLEISDGNRKGLDGVEKWLDNQLKGVSGKRVVIKTNAQKIIELKEGSTPAKKGKNIWLTIDSKMQYYLNRALHKQLIIHQADSASALLVEVKNGSIRAIVSQPTFNPNLIIQRSPYRTRFRTIVDRFEAGSTQKPFLVAAGLESGQISRETTVNITTNFEFYDYSLEENRALGVRTVSEVIQYSLNSGIVKLAQKIEPKYFWQLLNKLSVSSEYNPLTGELGVGSLSHYNSWNSVQYYTMTYGYGLEISMRELIAFYVAVANGGVVPPIHLWDKKKSEINQSSKPERRIMKKEVADEVKQMLNLATSRNGTGYLANIANYEIAGKTGTVRSIKKINPNNKKETIIQYRSLFVGMVPYENPKYVLAIIINNPQKSIDYYSGGKVAAPVFAEVMGNIMKIKE